MKSQRKAKQSMAVPNWSDLLDKGEPPLPPLKQIPGYSKRSEELGWKLLKDFQFRSLGKTEPFGKNCPKWMEKVARFIFGTEDLRTGHRLVNEVLLTISKKNGKTTLFSLILLTMWVKSRRKDAKAMIIAPTKEAANIAYDTIKNAIQDTPWLEERFGFVETQKKIRSFRDDKELKITSKGTDAVVGMTAPYVYMDELHQLGRSAKTRELLQHVRGARTGRPDALTMVTSTHAHEIGSDTWEAIVEMGRKIRDGEFVGAGTSAYISYEWTKEELRTKAFEDPKLWHKTNPSLGVIINKDTMQGEADQQKATGAAEWDAWTNQFLNVPPGMHRTEHSWEGTAYWDACYDETISEPGILGLQALLDRCDVAVAGIDGGSIQDWLGLVILGIDRETGRWLAWGHAWAHERYINEKPEYGAKVRAFERRGEITVVPDLGDPKPGETRRSIDLDEMVDVLCLCNEYNVFPKVAAIGIDGVAGVHYEQRIVGADDEYAPASEQIGRIKQGAWLHDAITGLPRRMQNGRFGHCGSDAMHWCATNAQMTRKANGYYAITREGIARDQKMDLFIALLNATFVMLKHQHDDPTIEIIGAQAPRKYA